MERSSFEAQGYVGPRRVMTESERALLAASLVASMPAPVDWPKGAAVSSRLMFDLAIRRAVLDPVVEFLGRDVVLWGASIVTVGPGHLHPHHVDIETSHPEARTVTAWIGLEHATRESSLRLVAGTHRYGAPIQRVAFDHGTRRGEYGESDVLAWAAERDPAASIVTLDISDGEAIWFDGHLWHGSLNQTPHVRRAILLQYATANTPIRIPDFSSLEWPFRFYDAPRPPCIVVSGEGSEAINRLVPAPVAAGGGDPVLTTWAKQLPFPLPQDPESGFRPHHLFRGATGNTAYLNCHVSTLRPGVSPHEPHTHVEEELLIVLTGEAEVTFDDATGRRTQRVGRGAVAYYPAGRAHTLRALGDEPAQYMMLKWVGASRADLARLDSGVQQSHTLRPGGDGGFRAAGVFEGPTTYLSRLHCHVTELDPDAGYESHVDAHDVVIVVFEGTVATVGATVEAPAIVFTSGGVAHGMRNVGESTARYLVFEFHGNAPEPLVALPPAPQVADPIGATEPAEILVATPPIGGARRARISVWNAGGRALRRFPRVHGLLRRMLRPASPWR